MESVLGVTPLVLVAPRAEMPSACGGSSLMRVSQPESLGATDPERGQFAPKPAETWNSGRPVAMA